jgi:hypothetical protein
MGGGTKSDKRDMESRARRREAPHCAHFLADETQENASSSHATLNTQHLEGTSGASRDARESTGALAARGTGEEGARVKLVDVSKLTNLRPLLVVLYMVCTQQSRTKGNRQAMVEIF